MAFICPTIARNTCLFIPSAARTFERCSRDAHLNRPITAQQRTSCHAAIVGVDGGGLSTSSRSTLRDRAAQTGIISETTNYEVFSTVSFLISSHQI
ncbi:hypothetical protein Y032_0383g382 [Ancylostoma ceylanicum]|uniref:Uncharacterized protein n=1 Tax=Ancylostoma ceylanicum TaxID=53326 RepID=A0A016RT16_9BILA|nr:hypothetical protein Y032_0383g382 [Ancylostoma ceylanicum]